MPLHARARTTALVALLVYVVFVGFVAFWPVPVDRPFDIALFRLLDRLDRFGIRPIDAYGVLEFSANILFFAVPALLVVLVVGRRRWWIAPVAGFVCSAAIEVTQHLLLPERFGTVSDVIANTLGALAGAAVGVLMVRRRERTARPG